MSHKDVRPEPDMAKNRPCFSPNHSSTVWPLRCKDPETRSNEKLGKPQDPSSRSVFNHAERHPLVSRAPSMPPASTSLHPRDLGRSSGR